MLFSMRHARVLAVLAFLPLGACGHMPGIGPEVHASGFGEKGPKGYSGVQHANYVPAPVPAPRADCGHKFDYLADGTPVEVVSCEDTGLFTPSTSVTITKIGTSVNMATASAPGIGSVIVGGVSQGVAEGALGLVSAIGSSKQNSGGSVAISRSGGSISSARASAAASASAGKVGGMSHGGGGNGGKGGGVVIDITNVNKNTNIAKAAGGTSNVTVKQQQ